MKPYNSDMTIEEFVTKHAKPYDESTDNYLREPFAKDTRVGRSGPLFNAHTYHTKVPPEGIVPYIMHYTEPGNVILDPFAGSGMTGVAAILSAKPTPTIELPRGASLGPRNTILNDLSPAACHIAFNYCHPLEPVILKKEVDRILSELNEEFSWLYGTTHDNGIPGIIQYVIWSDVFRCCRCAESIVIWDAAVDLTRGEVTEAFECSHCGFRGTKRDHSWVGSIPVLVNYKWIDPKTGKKKRSERRPNRYDLAKLEDIRSKEIPYCYPTYPFGQEREMWRGIHRDAGITRVCDFYTKRNLWALASLWNAATRTPNERTSQYLKFLVTSFGLKHASRMTAIILKRGSKPVLTGNQPGTLYIPSLSAEKNLQEVMLRKAKSIMTAATSLLGVGGAIGAPIS